jgi:hypothetical protein
MLVVSGGAPTRGILSVSVLDVDFGEMLSGH